jgi:hypothetical protein
VTSFEYILDIKNDKYEEPPKLSDSFKQSLYRPRQALRVPGL